MPPNRALKKAVQSTSRSVSSGSRRSNSLGDQLSDIINHGHDNDVDMGEEYEIETDMAHELRVMEDNLKRSMAMDVGVRKEQKQQRLEKEFSAQVIALEKQIETRELEHQKECQQIQNAYLDRLTALVERKTEVEKQIVRRTHELAEEYLATKEEFEAVLQGRSGDVHEAIRELKKVAGDAVAN